ncbi:MAG: hypothetical protein JWO60_2783, partial [Frankiales bacterium]|nr:hypothetical protein [Frankiales bacterium]
PDYFERVDSGTFEVDPDGDLLVVAARVGTTRLLDNRVLETGRSPRSTLAAGETRPAKDA